MRVEDNAALWHAVREAQEVVPILVLSKNPSYNADTPRRRFVRRAITELDAQLRDRGTRLHIRFGDPEREIPAAAEAYGAGAVYAARIYDEPGVQRDARIQRALQQTGKELHLVKDRVMRESHEVLTAQGDPYKVFTPFKRRWLALSEEVARPFPDAGTMTAVTPVAGSVTVDKLGNPGYALHWVGDEAPGKRLARFLRTSLAFYDIRRDLPAADGTSKLSHHLALGTLSPRRVYWEAMDLQRSRGRSVRPAVEMFISELLWREFYYHILTAFPFVLKSSFREEFRAIPWRRSTLAFERWKDGMTGYPIVDAGMRQLNEEGWMHNRVRMVVASFLTKDLHVSWQWGERYFMDRLIDLDLASNNGGWQWVAGTGTDAAPWFRIFNPAMQGKKFDPEGAYVRRYVPELARVPARMIHEPWLMSQQDQEAFRCVLGRHYPKKLVEHAEARELTRKMYARPA
ncbi:MAG: deoxyribodipyrimidine photo-lyase [Bacteroidetes bacterium]|nr:deoxyribodipyrimidine photo-lyase [Bacteroidota bacterium]